MISKNLDLIVKNADEVFLLDLSWHLHRNWHIFKWMSAGDNGLGRPTGHIYGILNTIQSIKEKNPKAVIILCKDGVPIERNDMFNSVESSYKEGRPELEFNFYDDVPVIVALSYMVPGVYLAYDPCKEADDIMYALAKQTEEISEAKIYIFSGDDDLLQGITDRIKVIRKFEGKGDIEEIDNNYILTDETMLKKFHGVDSHHLPYYRCIVGDKSDKVPGIPRFPREFASRIAKSCEKFGDIYNFKGPLSKTEQKYYDMLLSSDWKSVIEMNYNMMKLTSDIDVPLSRKKVNVENTVLIIRKYKLSKFEKYVKSFNWL